MLKFQSIREIPRNIEIRRRHDMTGSIVIFSSLRLRLRIHPKKNQLNLKLNERKEKKRNQTILSTSFGRDYNKCRSQCIATGVVRNFSSFIQIGRTQITLFKVLLSFFPWKQVPNMCAPVSWHRKHSVFFDLVCFELRRSQNLSHDLVSSTDFFRIFSFALPFCATDFGNFLRSLRRTTVWFVV